MKGTKEQLAWDQDLIVLESRKTFSSGSHQHSSDYTDNSMCSTEVFLKILIIPCRGPLQSCSELSKPAPQVIKSSALKVCKIHSEVYEPSSPLR